MAVNASHKAAGVTALFFSLGFLLGRVTLEPQPAAEGLLAPDAAALEAAAAHHGGQHLRPAPDRGQMPAARDKTSKMSNSEQGWPAAAAAQGTTATAVAPLLQYTSGPCGGSDPAALAALSWLNFSRAELANFLSLNAQSTLRLHSDLATLASAESTTQVAVALARLANDVGGGALRLESAVERRYVLVSMLLALLLYSSPAAAQSAQSLLAAVAGTHTRHMRRLAQGPLDTRAPLYLLHVSKAGGTSLCSLSHYNRCLEHPKANNCWIPGAGPVWFATFRHKESTCKQYMDVVREHKLDIIANEGYLDGGTSGSVPALCPEMMYTTMLRKPLSRVVSHMFQAGVKPPGFSREDFKKLSVIERIKLKPEVSSNYMTRVMLGKEAYYSGLNALNVTHGQQAQRLLSQFDIVLLLEQKTRVPILLEQALGWWNSSDLDRKHGRRSHGGDRLRDLSPEDHNRIVEANKLDLMVRLFRVDPACAVCSTCVRCCIRIHGTYKQLDV